MRTAYFPRLTGGLARDVDRYTIGPQSYPRLWADLKNLISYKGRLQRREGVTSPAVFDNLAPPEGTATADYPILISSVLLLDNQDRYIVVTTQDMYVGRSATAWDCVTPTYTHAEGVDVTNGSATVNSTGGSPNWVARRIAPGQKISIAGVWYTIATVPSNTQLTLTANYAGANASAVAYSIRRIFLGTSVLRPHAWLRVLNGDAYLVVRGAGVYQNPTTSGMVMTTAAVFKISRAADSAKTSFSSADTSILMSTDAMDSTTEALGDVILPKGFEILEDGRLIVAAHVQNKTGTVGSSYYINNRILYSSPTDLTEWTVSPGGFTDLIGGRGGITAMRRMGAGLAVHFNDGIQLAAATGADDPPLAARPTQAYNGASGPLVVLPVPAGQFSPQGQFFLGGDGRPYVFDGDRTHPIPAGWEFLVRDSDGFSMDTIAIEGRLALDEHRRSVSLFHSGTEDSNGSPSMTAAEYYYDLDTGVSGRKHWKNFISATNEPRMFGPLDPGGSGAYTPRVIGVRGTNSLGAATEYLYSTNYDTLNDSVLPLIAADGTTGGMKAETEDLLLWDISQPNNLEPAGVPGCETVIRHITVWVVGRASTTETLKCSISKDSGASYTAGTAPKTLTTATNELKTEFFFDTVGASEKWRIKIESNDSDVFSFALTRMAVRFTVVADGCALDN